MSDELYKPRWQCILLLLSVVREVRGGLRRSEALDRVRERQWFAYSGRRSHSLSIQRARAPLDDSPVMGSQRLRATLPHESRRNGCLGNKQHWG